MLSPTRNVWRTIMPPRVPSGRPSTCCVCVTTVLMVGCRCPARTRNRQPQARRSAGPRSNTARGAAAMSATPRQCCRSRSRRYRSAADRPHQRSRRADRAPRSAMLGAVQTVQDVVARLILFAAALSRLAMSADRNLPGSRRAGCWRSQRRHRADAKLFSTRSHVAASAPGSPKLALSRASGAPAGSGLRVLWQPMQCWSPSAGSCRERRVRRR